MKTRSSILVLLNTALFILLLLLSLFAVYETYISRPPTPVAGKDAPPASHSHTAQTIQDYAEKHGFSLADYPDSLLDLLERNPETEQFVLEYPIYAGTSQSVDLSSLSLDTVPLFLQWDQRWGYLNYGSDVAGLTACGPVCLSMAAVYVTGDIRFSPDYMIDFAIREGYCVEGDGTSWTLISQGGPALGLDVTEIPLDEQRIAENLQVGNPIICVVGPGDFTSTGHYLVFCGYEDGKIRIHDPNSLENSKKLWAFSDISDQILNLWVIR